MSDYGAMHGTRNLVWGVLLGVPLAFGGLVVSAASPGVAPKPTGERGLVLAGPVADPRPGARTPHAPW
ncbi:hypothetical protein [Actinocorallia aurea]